MTKVRFGTSIFLGILMMTSGRLSAQSMADSAKKEIAAVVQEKRSRTAVERKLSTSLLYARRQSQGVPMVAGLGHSLDRVAQRAGVERSGMVVLDVHTRITPALIQDVINLGGQVLFQSAKYESMRV